jgi:tetratricopeptide (TPR) repeat protein
MQALKKAERAKQNSLSDDEIDRPSEAFDEILALTPEPGPSTSVSAPASTPARAPAPAAFSLEPMDGLSLEPLAPPVSAATDAATPRPAPSPLPPVSDHKEPGLTMDLALDPIAAPPLAKPAPSAPAPAPAIAPAPPPPAAPPRAAAATPASAAPAAAAAAAAPGKKTTGEAANGKPPSGARARSRTAAAAEPSSFDPERLRLIGLIALLVLLVGGFGIYYWIALTGPGAGAGLPPVPMPPQNATSGATSAGQIIVVNPGAGSTATGPDAANGGNTGIPADADDPLLGPTTASRGNQQDLERRLERTEQELAAAQQAIQAAAAPRPERMPVLTAPKNDDIRVTRIVQPAPVAPALDRAYQAFNSGDTAGAQQQYDAALAQDANNRDALLGAAHVAARQNQKDKAASYYLRLLELSPNDADATAGLIGLRQGDISQSEARLKAILANTPDAGPILFALGNLYAQQGRWPDAQQAYFRAVGAAPDNPDYAYNLAIGLDRLNQGKLALGYYQRALALAQDKAVGFDRNALRKRMHELSTAPH